MKSASLFELLALLSCAAAFTTEDNVVGLGFTVKRTPVDESHLGHMKRGSSGYIQAALANEVVQYFAAIELGTPGQTQNVVLDTGSSDLWVMESSNPYCLGNSGDITTANQVNCTGTSMFNQTASNSFVSNNTAFAIAYGDTTAANGTFAQDDLSIGGVTVNMINFAVASSSNSTSPVFGVGPAWGQSTVMNVTADGVAYPTYTSIIQSMVGQGLIQSVAFSLWLNDINADSGNILFGGVDTAKYSGDLISMPIIVTLPSYSIPVQQALANYVQMTGMGVTIANQTTSIASGGFPVLLDSGTSLAYLPDEWVEALGTSIGGFYSEDLGLYVVDCDNNMADTVSFDLAGNSFPVSLEEMLFPVTDANGDSILDGSGNALCGLGILGGGAYNVNATYILGDVFLRGAYVVYDYDTSEIAVAIANLNETASSIVPISTGIPNATPASSYNVTTFVSSFSTITGLASGATSANVTSDIFSTDGVDGLVPVPTPTGAASATGDSTGTSNATGSASATKNAAVKTGVIAGLGFYLLNMLL